MAEAAERARAEAAARAEVARRAAAEAAANARAEARAAFIAFAARACANLGVHFGHGFRGCLGCRPAFGHRPALSRRFGLGGDLCLFGGLALGRGLGFGFGPCPFSSLRCRLAFGLGSGRRVGSCPFSGDRRCLAFGRCSGLRGSFHLFSGLALVIRTAQAPPLQERLVGSRHRNRCDRGRLTDRISGERPAAAFPGAARRRRHLVCRALRRPRADRDHRCSSTRGTAAAAAAPAAPSADRVQTGTTAASVPAAPPPAAAAPAAPDPSAAAAQMPTVEVREVQNRLRAMGFNPGPVDGSVGPLTENAAKQYQRARGLEVTGAVDRNLLAELRQETPPPRRYSGNSYASNTAAAQRRPRNDFERFPRQPRQAVPVIGIQIRPRARSRGARR